MRKLAAGLLALLLVVGPPPMAAFAGDTTITYQPGVAEAAIAKGETVLIHYKSTW